MTETGYPSLDVLGKFRGPCAICGGPDARHRLADALVGAVEAGDSPESVAEDYGVRLGAVDRLIQTRQANRARRKARWT